MPCERETAAIETELHTLAQEKGRYVGDGQWTHRPGGNFRLTVSTSEGNQVLEFPLPEVAEYFHRVTHTREAVRTRLTQFVERLPQGNMPATAGAPSDGRGGNEIADIVSEALTRIKAIEMILVKKGLTTKDELNTLVELLNRPSSTR